MIKRVIRNAAIVYRRMQRVGILRDLVALVIAVGILVVGIVLLGIVVACWQSEVMW